MPVLVKEQHARDQNSASVGAIHPDWVLSYAIPCVPHSDSEPLMGMDWDYKGPVRGLWVPCQRRYEACQDVCLTNMLQPHCGLLYLYG